MTTGNQTLLLSGSLLSNAATELAQTLRVDLLQLLDQPVSTLVRYGLSETTISILKTNGFVLVQDLNFLQVSHLRPLGFPQAEVPLLTQVCNEVRRTISVGSLSKILKNASQNITEIAASLPIKNTFIEFPNLFAPASVVERHPQSCPAFFLEEERKALEELGASIQQQGFINRAPEKSRGASDHGTGNCKPCAWFHHADGCRHGTDCEFCHLCPNGEIKKRKKEKQKLIRAVKAVDPTATPDIDVFGSPQPSPSWIGSIFSK